MKTMSARQTANAFGLMIDTARAGSVLIGRRRCGVVEAVAVEEYERLSTRSEHADKAANGTTGAIASRS